MLTDSQKQNRLDISKILLDKFQEDSENFLSRFVTMDKTWVHHFDPGTKQQSSLRLSSPIPKKFRVVASAGKVMSSIFWDSQGILLIDYLECRTTITGKYYAALISKLRNSIKEKRGGKLRRGFFTVSSRQCTRAQVGSCNVCHSVIWLRIG